jgi:hypothetical protein
MDDKPKEQAGKQANGAFDRRAFLRGLKGWSGIVAGLALVTADPTTALAGSWINSRGGWINGGGSWVNRGGSWINGGGGGWINHAGGWINGGGSAWVNRRGWLNAR